MATIIVNTKVDEFVWNKLYIRIYDITLAVYATGGFTPALGFSPAGYHLKKILGISQIGCDAGADLIVGVRFDFTNNKLLAYRGGTFTPAGTIAAPTISILGGAAGTAIGIDSDANGASLTKAAATTRTGILGVQAPAFTGTTQGQQSFAEVSNAIDLSAVKVRCMIFGR